MGYTLFFCESACHQHPVGVEKLEGEEGEEGGEGEDFSWFNGTPRTPTSIHIYSHTASTGWDTICKGSGLNPE